MEGTTQVRYAKSNYATDRWASDEAYLADESTVIHSGESVDLGQELVTVTVWNNDDAHKTMACLAVNTNGDRLTEDFTITETADKVYTVSSNFTLVENPDVDLTIDIVYTPYFDLLFFPTFYHNTLYADGVNGGSSTEARIVKSPSNIYFDEEEMTIKSNDENDQVTFYIDSYSSINQYMSKYISMVQRYVNLADWKDYKFNQSQLYNYFLPCFNESQYNAIVNNLIDSGKNVDVVSDKNIINKNRNNLYPIYVKINDDNAFTYNNYITIDTMTNVVGFGFLSSMILSPTQDCLINVKNEEIYAQCRKWWMSIKNLVETQLIYANDSGSAQDNYLINFSMDVSAIKIVNQLHDTQKYSVNNIFAKNYLPKDAQTGDGSRQLIFSEEEWTDLELTLTMLDASVDVNKTISDNYLIMTNTVRNNKNTNINIFVPTTKLPFYSHELFRLS